MLNYFVYNGVSSKHFHTYLSGAGVFELPKRDIQKIEIPGRNGDLTVDNGRYENVEVTYPIIVMQDFENNKRSMIWQFNSGSGYKRLEDTFNPSYFRLARFNGVEDSKSKTRHDAGTYTISFDCKPQLFLKTGEMPIDVSGSKVIFNPTNEIALPLIEITGTGDFSINGDYFVLLQNTSTVIVDSEAKEVYEGTINRNDDFERYNNELPKIYAGKNVIECASGLSLSIKPRWWTI